MEGKLFLISVWCGIYGLVLRKALKIKSLNESKTMPVLMNAFFWGTAGFLAALLITSYTEKLDALVSYAIKFVSVGIVFGAVKGYLNLKNENKKELMIQDNLEWADTGFSAILLASVVMFFVVQAFKIPSGSMRMTFVEGDHLFVNKFIYGFPIPLTKKKVLPLKTVKREDIVVFRFPTDDKNNTHYGKDFIKRVIALPGEEVKIVNKVAYVNGKALIGDYQIHGDSEVYATLPYISSDTFQMKWQAGEMVIYGNDIRDNFGPVVVPNGHVFVMGDNRDHSYDSRYWGPLPLTEIKGKAWLLYFPFKRFKVAR